MKDVSNAFAVLNLDAEDDKEQIITDIPARVGNHVITSDKDMEKTYLLEQRRLPKKEKQEVLPKKEKQEVLPKKEKQEVQSMPESSESCKSPLVWIDLEMTGLDIEVDRILEIACIVTDGKLSKVLEGPDLVIHQSKECLDNMGEWCQKQHAASGLTERVLQSTLTEEDAEKQIIEFLKKHMDGTYKASLAGNSVYVDLSFLKKFMPTLADLFSHVLVDVSSVKALCYRWYPTDHRKAPRKKNNHRAMDDIQESIKELRFYKENIFKPPRSRQ